MMPYVDEVELRTVFGDTVAALEAAGCIAAAEEAHEIIDTASDARHLAAMIERRVGGEPLEWIVGQLRFAGHSVLIDGGVYVPRWHTEALVERAAELLPPNGILVDLCTGSGAIAAAVAAARSDVQVVATDCDPAAVACARRNGVDALLGDLDDPLPPWLRARVDVLTAVVPYVPTAELRLLPRDVREHEPRSALDGGRDGLDVLRRVVERSVRWLRCGGWLLLELGGDQALPVCAAMQRAGFDDIRVCQDAEGDDRGIEGRFAAGPGQQAR